MSMFSRRRIVLSLLVIVLLGTAGTFWYYHSRAPVAEPPAIPNKLTDPQVERAVERARESVVENPRSAAAWGELGCVFRANEINPQAVLCFAQAGRLNPDDARWPYLIGITNLHINSGDVVPHLRAAYTLEHSPERKGAIRLRLAEALLDEGKLEEAADLLHEQMLLTPADPRTHLDLGMLALAHNQLEEAVRELELASSSPFARQRAARSLALAHRQLGHLKESESYEKQAIGGSQDPAWPDPFNAEYLSRRVGKRALNERVNELEAQGQYWEAASVAEELARTYPDEASKITLGKVLGQAGSLARSEEVLRGIIHENDASVAGHFFLARTLSLEANEARNGGETTRGVKLDEAAVSEYRRCLALKPGHGPAHVDLGRVLARLGQHEEAVKICGEAVQISPQAVETHLALGEVLIGAGKAQEAIPVLEEAVRLSSVKDTRASKLLEKTKAAGNR